MIFFAENVVVLLLFTQSHETLRSGTQVNNETQLPKKIGFHLFIVYERDGRTIGVLSVIQIYNCQDLIFQNFS